MYFKPANWRAFFWPNFAGMRKRHFITISDLTDNEISSILEDARSIVSTLGLRHDRVYTLSGRTAALAFFEPSTRTRLSFETASHRLGIAPVVFQTHGSSLEKGESLIETVPTIEAMRFDVIIIRHGSNGMVEKIADSSSIPIVSAGEGTCSHPTQALLDVSTLLEYHGSVKGLKVGVVGDIRHSRVARSQVALLRRLGASVRLCAPDEFLPTAMDNEYNGLDRLASIEDVLRWWDVLSLLRIQRERIGDNLVLSLADYRKQYAFTTHVASNHPSVTVIHPGPINSGVEVDEELLTNSNVLIRRQVTHGVAVRMAVLRWLLGT